MHKLGEYIRYLREQQQWTQLELSQKVSVSRPVLTRWESGQLTPDVQSLIKLSNLFNVSIDELVGHERYQKEMIKEHSLLYQQEEQEGDHELVDIVRYLQYQPQIKKGLYKLSQLPPPKRKALEKMLCVALDDIIKAMG